MNEKIILIVDDEKDVVATIVKKMLRLKDERWLPVMTFDGHEALEMIRKYNVACVILDINMRVMNGLEVCRKMAKDVNMKSIPVIISSGHIQEHERNELASLGYKYFLDKPYPIDHLFTLLKEILV